jgi:hypothetical protein
MKNIAALMPLLTAIISAMALLSGYMYQKHKDKQAEIRKTRQEIYSRLITNVTSRIDLYNDSSHLDAAYLQEISSNK